MSSTNRRTLNAKRRLDQDDQYKKRNRQRACISKKRRLAENIECRQQHREIERRYKRRRLEDNFHKDKDNNVAKIAMKKRWDRDHKYREAHRKTNKCRKLKKKTLKPYQNKHPTQKQAAAYKLVLSSRQRYWKRRGRLLASSKHRAKELLLQQKMSKHSNVPAFDVSRLFKSATHTERTSMKTLRYQHTKLSDTVGEALSCTNDYQCCIEEDLEATFGPRIHTACSEPYFWEQCYRTVNSTEIIPIDRNGQARLFVMLQHTKKRHMKTVTKTTY